MKNIIYLLFMVFCISCTGDIKEFTDKKESPSIFPDYADVTIPVNIAPLNFKLTSSCEAIQVKIKSGTDEIICNGKYKISIPLKKWRNLLKDNTGKKIEVVVLAKEQGKWYKYKSFFWHIKPEPIDSHLVYRLIEPGYEAWNKMGIYQRNLESYKESPLYENKMNGLSCINCHSFCNQDPKTYIFHMRTRNDGTYMVRNGKTERLNMKNDRVASAARYPYWHPTGKYMAFSINDTHQFFHSSDRNRVEVFDSSSDVVVYDVENYQYIMSPLLNRKDAFETFPSFSPDGKTLYFCSADSVPMPERFQEAKYSLYKISFDPENGTIGNRIDTLFSARSTGKSVTYPRISPDGKYMMVSMADYGQFHVWHKEADIYMIDLSTDRIFKPENVNSNDVESYHSWSSNSRWFVFSSRRVDGLHTSPFFAYIDKQGKTYKPFMLPQKDADFYDSFLKSYNIPELVNGKIKENTYHFDHVAKNQEARPVK